MRSVRLVPSPELTDDVGGGVLHLRWVLRSGRAHARRAGFSRDARARAEVHDLGDDRAHPGTVDSWGGCLRRHTAGVRG